MRRRVSVLMPCYNSRATLPLALASLLAQTYDDWECVIVDDGSDDHPEEVVRRAGDDRIRLVRLERNRGRGHARQVALAHASGELLSLLDADDWIYPEKLERQVSLLQRHADVAFVSTGMAIVNAANDLVSVRCRGREGAPTGPLPRPAPLAVAHAPAMMRMEAARALGYDTTLTAAEDFDFLLRLMLRCRFIVDDSVSYAYFEMASASLPKLLASLRNTRRILGKYWYPFPITVTRELGIHALKEMLYRAAFAAGQERHLFQRRSRPAELAEIAEFERARQVVRAQLTAFETIPATWDHQA